ncbi:MAG: hypothetical protein ABIH70_06450 [Chloroflexota bacterium]
MVSLFEAKFKEWTEGKDPLQARISIYEHVRDIPYALVPELNDPEKYVDILRVERGSCTPKHFLLGNMYLRLGLLVLYVVYPFRWSEFADNYPSRLRRLAEEAPPGHHLACKVEIEGRLVLVDATLDPVWARYGFLVNLEWDGYSNTVLPMELSGDEELYHPGEARLMKASYSEKTLAFYRELNAWLDARRV